MALVTPTPANGEQSQDTQSYIAEETPASKIGSEGIDFPYQFNGSPSRQKELDIAVGLCSVYCCCCGFCNFVGC